LRAEPGVSTEGKDEEEEEEERGDRDSEKAPFQ
jgi:hypothetical protein